MTSDFRIKYPIKVRKSGNKIAGQAVLELIAIRDECQSINVPTFRLSPAHVLLVSFIIKVPDKLNSMFCFVFKNVFVPKEKAGSYSRGAEN